MNILLIEDSKAISKGVVYALEQGGYSVTLSETFESALQNADKDFDLLIIDVNLPDGDGFELFTEFSKLNPTPAIFLTANDDEDSIVQGFDLGADDYITKPFSMRELMARIKRITRSNDKSDIVTVGDIQTNLSTKEVLKNGERVEFTALEYRIFSMLVQNYGKTVTRELILERIWDLAGNFVNDNTLTVYIKRIRKKLDTDLIKTVKGLGYRLEE